MAIRQATRQDIPALLELLASYASENPIACLRDKNNHDVEYIKNLLFSIISGRGFILVDDKYNGFLIAFISSNVWAPKVKELKELAWWVKPECRNGILGGRLWKQFDNLAEQMLVDKRIDFVCSSITGNGSFVDYTKRDYKVLDATFYRD